jgi:hypothetical protein
MSNCVILTDKQVEYTVELQNSQTTVYHKNSNFPLLDGWQALKLSNFNQDFKIKDILINNQSISYNIYSGFGIGKNSEYFQPCTEINCHVDSWVIFLHDNPLLYKTQLLHNFKNQELGKNLPYKHCLFWDVPRRLNKDFTTYIHEFYNHSFGFFAYEHNNRNHMPWVSLDIDYPMDTFWNDVKDLQLTESINPSWKHWFRWKYYNNHNKHEDITVNLPFKNIKEWLISLKIDSILKFQVSKLGSGGYIEPHRDEYVIPHNNGITTQIYLPINDVGNSFLKFDGGGILPKGCNIINNVDHVHSAVNDSDDDRYVIIIGVELSHDFYDKHALQTNIIGYDSASMLK